METKNYIAKLNEYKLRTQADVKYKDVAAVGPDHIKQWVALVLWCNFISAESCRDKQKR